MKRDGAEPKPLDVTVEEYLSFDRGSDFRHEYFEGLIVAMTGASREHNLVTGNIARHLGNQLAGKPCETYSSDMRVRTHARGYVYPDVVVVCEAPQIENEDGVDTLLNPMVVIEVLSPSTEAYDRGKKAYYYRGVSSLKDYILITQDEMHVEHYSRQPAGNWILHRDLTASDDRLVIESLECELLLSEIYERVRFPPAA